MIKIQHCHIRILKKPNSKWIFSYLLSIKLRANNTHERETSDFMINQRQTVSTTFYIVPEMLAVAKRQEKEINKSTYKEETKHNYL